MARHDTPRIRIASQPLGHADRRPAPRNRRWLHATLIVGLLGLFGLVVWARVQEGAPDTAGRLAPGGASQLNPSPSGSSAAFLPAKSRAAAADATATAAPTPHLVDAPTFLVNAQPVGCHAFPDAGSEVVAQRAPGTIQAMDQVVQEPDGIWYREAEQHCWTRADAALMACLVNTLSEAGACAGELVPSPTSTKTDAASPTPAPSPDKTSTPAPSPTPSPAPASQSQSSASPAPAWTRSALTAPVAAPTALPGASPATSTRGSAPPPSPIATAAPTAIATRSAAQPTDTAPPAVVPGSRGATPAPAAAQPTASASSTEPEVWTVILYSLSAADGRSRDDAERAAAGVRAAGFDADVVFSSDFGSLRPGYWVVFSGSFTSQKDADAFAATLRAAGFADAYPRLLQRT